MSSKRGAYVGTQERRHVMACHSCNHARAAIEQANLGIEELHRRARNHRRQFRQNLETVLTDMDGGYTVGT